MYQQKYQFLWAKEVPNVSPIVPKKHVETTKPQRLCRWAGDFCLQREKDGKKQATSEIPNDCDQKNQSTKQKARNLKVTTRHDQGLTDAWMHFPGTRRTVNVTYPYVSCSLSPWNKEIPLFLPLVGVTHPEVRLIEEERLERRCHRWEQDHQQQEGKNHPIGPPNTKLWPIEDGQVVKKFTTVTELCVQ